MTPPGPIRRPVSVGFGLCVSVALHALAPPLLAVAWLARALGRPRPLIAVRLVLAYSRREAATIVACGGLWVASAGGRYLDRPRMRALHWSLLRWYVGGLAAQAIARFELRLDEDCPAEVADALATRAPVIVLSRHAGPGDTILLIDRLAAHFGRRPSVVLREAVALDPAIDLLTARLPHGVIDSGERGDSEATIEALARDLRPGGALLLYPEGGNFTVARRRSALARLRRQGRTGAAAAAQRMEHLLPPRPTGVRAALRGRPDATVLFVAHTGLGLASYPREIYRETPIGGTLHFRWWRVDPDTIPATEDGQSVWLNRWWREIDAWIDAQRTEPRP